MSTHQVPVVRVLIEDHPNADRLEVALVGGYRCIVGKGQFRSGDLVAYIPEQSVVPLKIQQELGVEGKLAGSNHDRVKAVRLRQVLSQGLVYPAREGWALGQDVADELGITKWEPPIPAAFAGEVANLGTRPTVSYDIENWRMHPDVLEDGEDVVYTEKIHGTLCQVVLLPKGQEVEGERVWCGSKGMGARGLMLRRSETNKQRNVYVKTMLSIGLDEKLLAMFGDEDRPVILLGEVFGAGVQDLAYDQKDLSFRAFDIALGYRGERTFLCHNGLHEALYDMGIPRVPVLYHGPHSKEKMDLHVDGKETISGRYAHIREGIVMRPAIERRDDRIPACGGRVQLKYVSTQYILRKGGTEHN